ncbi:MAG: GNAT family N-acetyltransferase [Planctomycetes bacterium]|nr:GNAT family N-acetyltransferase [Planctomycetota bacterium]
MKSLKPNSKIQLRAVADVDLAVFFDYQLDKQANYMAAFTAKDPNNRDAFDAHWEKIRGDEQVVIKTITVGEEVVGHVASFIMFEQREVTYWIGKNFWGKGIATKALTMFLESLKERPIYARAAKDNTASLRVLEKCGFTIDGEEKGYANARGQEIEEYILKLD